MREGGGSASGRPARRMTMVLHGMGSASTGICGNIVPAAQGCLEAGAVAPECRAASGARLQHLIRNSSHGGRHDWSLCLLSYCYFTMIFSPRFPRGAICVCVVVRALQPLGGDRATEKGKTTRFSRGRNARLSGRRRTNSRFGPRRLGAASRRFGPARPRHSVRLKVRRQGTRVRGRRLCRRHSPHGRSCK